MVNTPAPLKVMARRVKKLGVRPELESSTGQLVFVHDLIAEGLIEAPPLIQLCMGIPYGAPDDLQTLLALVNRLPAGCSSPLSLRGACSCPMWRWRRWW